MSDIESTSGWGRPNPGRENHIQSLRLALTAERPRTASIPSVMWPRSPAESDGTMYDPSLLSSPTTLSHTSAEMSESDYGSPGHLEGPSQNWTTQQQELKNIKRQYYEDIFTNRDPFGSEKARAEKASIIVADIKTNITIRDEHAFCTKLSHTLSVRYQRPETSIMFSVVQSACLFFGGTFDPAYILTITAIPTQVQPTTNKRNAYLLEKVIEEGLGITPNRGVIRFMPLAGENIALGGTTFPTDIADLENPRSRTARLWSIGGFDKRKPSVNTMRGSRSPSQVSANEKYKPNPPSEPLAPPPFTETQIALPEKEMHSSVAQKVQPGGRKKSFAVIFGMAS